MREVSLTVLMDRIALLCPQVSHLPILWDDRNLREDRRPNICITA